MQTGELTKVQDIYGRILQLEQRLTMDWYSRDQLLDDLHKLREVIHLSARRNQEIQNQLNNYYDKIDLLVDQII